MQTDSTSAAEKCSRAVVKRANQSQELHLQERRGEKPPPLRDPTNRQPDRRHCAALIWLLGVNIGGERMDRRYGPREPVSLDVEIYRGQCKLGRFTSCDISFEGMFVATKQLGLDVGELVTIRLSLKLSDIDGYTFRAIIVHRSNGGVGVMFADDDPIFFRVLDALSDAA
jgi:hypothetical protein